MLGCLSRTSFRRRTMCSSTGTLTRRGRNGRVLLTTSWLISAATIAAFSTCPVALAQVTYKVFVYGTLKVGEEHNYILANPENGMANLLGNAETVDRWPLVVLPSTGVPYMVPLKGEGYRVAGEVYVVDDKMLEKLDELESVPDSYYRTELDVELLDQPGNSAVPFKAGNYFATHYDERMLRLPYISNFTTV